VAREGIEPPTRGFSALLRGRSIEHNPTQLEPTDGVTHARGGLDCRISLMFTGGHRTVTGQSRPVVEWIEVRSSELVPCENAHDA
jgi:hypothetical protein